MSISCKVLVLHRGHFWTMNFNYLQVWKQRQLQGWGQGWGKDRDAPSIHPSPVTWERNCESEYSIRNRSISIYYLKSIRIPRHLFSWAAAICLSSLVSAALGCRPVFRVPNTPLNCFQLNTTTLKSRWSTMSIKIPILQSQSPPSEVKV